MIDSKSQKVADNSIGIQSGRDTNIGATQDDIRAIVETIADQVPKYAAIAAEIVEARLKGFEDKILDRFAKENAEARESFKDPDFQYLLRSAQHASARSGDDNIVDNLVDLIAERSNARTQSRIALTLNAAVDVVPKLTFEEISEITACFYLRQTRIINPKSVSAISLQMTALSAFADHISESRSSYAYMQSLGCGALSFGENSFSSLLLATYPGFFSNSQPLPDPPNGSNVAAVAAAGLAIKRADDTYQSTIATEDEFKKAIIGSGFNEAMHVSTWSQLTAIQYKDDDIISMVSYDFPKVTTLRKSWDSSPIKNFELSAIGSAIGYVNIRKTGKFNGDISIWLG